MERDKVLEQIMELPEKSRFLVGYNEMAKDLAPVMQEDEVIEGVTTAYKKNFLHMFKNGRAMRSFMAVTNKNIYVISRGRMIMSFVPFLKETIIIPRNEITDVVENELAMGLKLIYEGDITIKTINKEYRLYMGVDYKKQIPENLAVGSNMEKSENEVQNTSFTASNNAGATKSVTSGKSKVKYIIATAIVCVIAGFIFLSARDSNYISYVKEAKAVNYPNIKYGESFDYILKEEEWEYFEAETGEEVVEVGGKCELDNELIDVKIQFILNSHETGDFYIGACLINDTSVDGEFKQELIDAIFEGYEEHNTNLYDYLYGNYDYEW